jgi:AraC family transcriptional regulator
MLVGIPLDDPDVTPADKLRYDACLVVDGSVRPEGDVGVQETSGGEYAVLKHEGPYARIGDAYARLYGQWLPTSGRELRAAPNLLISRNWPPDASPDSLPVELFLPLEER